MITIGTVTNVKKVFPITGEFFNYIPTVEFTDEKGKRHTIEHTRFHRMTCKRWWAGDYVKVYYHPSAPKSGMIAPLLRNVFAAILIIVVSGVASLGKDHPFNVKLMQFIVKFVQFLS